MTSRFYLFTLATLCISAPALASSPSQQFTQGGPGAHVASSQGAGSIFWNPASIANLPNNQVHADLALSWRTAGYTRTINGADQDTARLLSFDYQPNLAFSRQLGDTGLTVGLGIGRDYLDRTHWLDEGGEQRWQSIYSGLRTWTITPTIAYSLTERLSLGANARLTRVHAYGYQAVDYGPIVARDTMKDDIPTDAPGNEGRGHADFKGNAGSWSLGGQFKLSAQTTLAASLTGETRVDINGKVSVYSPRNDYFEQIYGDQEEASASLEMTLPRTLRLGVAHKLSDEMEVHAGIDLVQWAQLDEVVVDVSTDEVGGIANPDQRFDTNFQNVAAVRAGLTKKSGADRALFAQVGYESSPVRSEHMSPLWLYGHSVQVTGGTQMQLDSGRRIGVAYTQRVMIPRTIEQSNQTPKANGTYTQFSGFLSLSFDWEIANKTLNLPDVQRAPNRPTNP